MNTKKTVLTCCLQLATSVTVGMSLTGCEAPLNLTGVEQTSSAPIRRTDQFQALASNGHTTVAVGNNGIVLTKAKDAGIWNRLELPNHPGLLDVESCPDGSFIALDFEQQIWRSDNEGSGWTPTAIDTNENLLDIACAPDGGYWAVGSFSTILNSQDHGLSWHAVSLEEDAILTNIQFLSPDVVIATGEFGIVARSENRGKDWTLLDPMYPDFYPHATYFATPETGWSAGLNGTLLETQDGGFTWEQLSIPVTTPLYGLSHEAGRLYITGDNATVLERRNNQWRIITAASGPVYLRAALTQGDTLLVAGGNGTLTELKP